MSLETTSKLDEEVAQMGMVFIPITIPSSAKSATIASWGMPYDWLAEEEMIRALFTEVLHVMQVPPTSGQLWYYTFSLGQSWKMPVKGNLHTGQNFQKYTCILFGMRKWWMYDYLLIHGLKAEDCLDDLRYGKSMIEKWERHLEKNCLNRSLQIGKGGEYILYTM